MSPALLLLHGSELLSPPPVSSRSLLLRAAQRGATTHDNNPFRRSRFGFGVKYCGFL
uniref:Uncharacterized protein n=1 Tax=Oryza brachyantha TaxID=4533 RepID=J3MWF7_ORYBR